MKLNGLASDIHCDNYSTLLLLSLLFEIKQLEKDACEHYKLPSEQPTNT